MQIWSEDFSLGISSCFLCSFTEDHEKHTNGVSTVWPLVIKITYLNRRTKHNDLGHLQGCFTSRMKYWKTIWNNLLMMILLLSPSHFFINKWLFFSFFKGALWEAVTADRKKGICKLLSTLENFCTETGVHHQHQHLGFYLNKVISKSVINSFSS